MRQYLILVYVSTYMDGGRGLAATEEWLIDADDIVAADKIAHERASKTSFGDAFNGTMYAVASIRNTKDSADRRDYEICC